MNRARGILALLLLTLPVVAGAAEGPPKGVKVHANKTVSVSLEAADLRAVVTALARTFELNIVGGHKLSGTVTLHLQNVPVDEAVEVILKNAGFELVRKEGGIFEILTPGEAERLQAAGRTSVLRVFTCKFHEPSKLAELLVPNAIASAKSITVDDHSSQLIIRGTPEELADVETLIQALDTPLPQVSIQARIVEIYTDRAKSLGVSLRVTAKSGQVGDNGVGIGHIDLGQAVTAVPTLNFTFASDRVDAALNALAQKDVAEVLSAPSITTGHGRQASIKVVNQVPYITRTTRVVDQVTVTDESITFKETGLTLTVTPRVLADGKIQMVVEPSVLELTGFTDTDPPAPIIDTRSAKTDVAIRDGRWLVIGGLMRYNERRLDRGVPLLKDIPLIGWLFRSKQTTREKSNLVILVSATVLTDRRSAAKTAAVEQALRDHRAENRLEGAPPQKTDAQKAGSPDPPDDPARRPKKSAAP